MSKVYIPQDYHTPLSVYEMQRSISAGFLLRCSWMKILV